MQLKGFTIGWLLTSLIFMPILVMDAFVLETALLYAYSLVAVTLIVALNRWLKRRFDETSKNQGIRAVWLTGVIVLLVGLPFLVSDQFAHATWMLVIEGIAFFVFVVAEFAKGWKE